MKGEGGGEEKLRFLWEGERFIVSVVFIVKKEKIILNKVFLGLCCFG